jgi:sporulation protein YlmC with PRC-barrel domain
MRSSLLYTASVLTLLAGPAFAQTTQGTAPADPATQAPAMGAEAPAGSPVMGTAPTALSVDDMMGKTVRGSDGESLGSVEDIIIDPQSGEARQLVISSGGFLGIGEKQIAVDLANANLTSGEDGLVLPNMTQADVENMPEFEMEEGMVSFNTRPDSATPGAANGTATR